MTPEDYAKIRLSNVIDAEANDRNSYKHPVVLYLVAMAQQEATMGFEGLMRVSPTDADGIREAQNRVELCQFIQRWLGDALDKGRELYAALREEEKDRLGEFLREDFELSSGADYND